MNRTMLLAVLTTCIATAVATAQSPAVPKAPPKIRTPALPNARPASEPAQLQVTIPRSLRVFQASVYAAERGIDGALLLTDAQKAQIAGLTESIRNEESRLNEQVGNASTREAKLAAAKELAKAQMTSQAKVRGLVMPVLTEQQKAVVATVDGTWAAAVAEVDEDFRTRLANAPENARKELEKAKPEMVVATFFTRLDEKLSDAQREAVAQRGREIGMELARLAIQARAKAKAQEIVARRAAERRRAEEERRAAEAAGKNFGAFRADASAHDWANAYLLAYASNLVYPDQLGMTEDFDDHEEFEDRLTTKLVALGFDAANVEFVTASSGIAIDAEAAVFSNATTVFVVFRGSESSSAADLRDWVTNANAFFTKLPAGGGYPEKSAVHTGMWNATNRIYRELRDEVNRQARGGKKVWITGHSLGGAMAGLFAGRYARSGADVQGVVTFAAPRCANGAFGRFVLDKAKFVQRWANKNDIVPMVPPDLDLEPFDGYDGANGHYVHFGRTAAILKNDRIDLSGSEVRVPNGDYLTGDAGQHSMALYCQAIRREMPAATREKMPAAPAR
jgi:hypothetical protein